MQPISGPAGLNSQTVSLPEKLSQAVQSTIADWRSGNKVQRLWQGDASIWTNGDESNWLGWLSITREQLDSIDRLEAIAAEIKAASFSHALLLGMGGSSLCPEVLSRTFGQTPGFPELQILDSTDPAQVAARKRSIAPPKTLYIVASKTGSTLEPNIFKQYFFAKAKEQLGKEKAGQHFIAITDPQSRLQEVAERDGFRQIFFGRKNIGGRYSALSDFGMVPAAIMGIDVRTLLQRSLRMVDACGPTIQIDENPGVVLGAILGTAALREFGHDKVTIITSPDIYDLGAWLEQLIAESTGKDGKGLIPVDRERLASPEVYGSDRIFVYLRLEASADEDQDAAVEAVERAGRPVLRIAIKERLNLGQEFFRWEMATAVAGSILGVNPFDQPDVEASKIATRELTSAYVKTGKLPSETPFLEDDGIKLFTDDRNLHELALPVNATLTLALRAHFSRLNQGDYFALLAYVEMNEAHEAILQDIRHAVRGQKHVATCLGFGPRFLHSTGQAYKGGPNSGVFLQITADDAADLPVPGENYTFGVVKAAQAQGDLSVLLKEKKRRALRIHLGPDVRAGLATLAAAVQSALLE
jgi:transaldolase / glucose-6-phosphate isomerase